MNIKIYILLQEVCENWVEYWDFPPESSLWSMEIPQYFAHPSFGAIKSFWVLVVVSNAALDTWGYILLSFVHIIFEEALLGFIKSLGMGFPWVWYAKTYFLFPT